MADNESMGEYTTPKSVYSSGMMGPGRGMGVVFVDRSKMLGAGQNPLAGRYVQSPFKRDPSARVGKPYVETYKETYEMVKAKHKWLPRLLIGPWTTLSAIPRHLMRHSIINSSYNPKRVVEFEHKFGNKL